MDVNTKTATPTINLTNPDIVRATTMLALHFGWTSGTDIKLVLEPCDLVSIVYYANGISLLVAVWGVGGATVPHTVGAGVKAKVLKVTLQYAPSSDEGFVSSRFDAYPHGCLQCQASSYNPTVDVGRIIDSSSVSGDK